jgi:uncharacterized membrane protein
MLYGTFKVVHLFGVIVFLGNIIVTALWKVLADRTGEPRIIAYAQQLVTLTDWIFTAGGVALILIGAYGMAFVAGLDLRQTWLVWGQGLLAVSGLIWVLVLIPTQIAQARQARAFAAGGAIPDSYWRHGRRWMVWGVVATIIPLARTVSHAPQRRLRLHRRRHACRHGDRGWQPTCPCVWPRRAAAACPPSSGHAPR